MGRAIELHDASMHSATRLRAHVALPCCSHRSHRRVCGSPLYFTMAMGLRSAPALTGLPTRAGERDSQSFVFVPNVPHPAGTSTPANPKVMRQPNKHKHSQCGKTGVLREGHNLFYGCT